MKFKTPFVLFWAGLLVFCIGILFSLHPRRASTLESVFTITENSGKPDSHFPATTPTPTPGLRLPTPPEQKILPGGTHVFQTFNNCGPAAMSMALSYFGINETQQKLGELLRPYQNKQGDNDDKSVTLSELARLAPEYNLLAYHRPNGTLEIVKQFIAHDMPVVTRTWLKPNDDIGHFRVIKGYDDATGEFIQDDSLQGKNLRYSYTLFIDLWKKFSYEYVVFVPREKQEIAEAILGTNTDEKFAWNAAVRLSQEEIAVNPDDVYARFNLSVAYYHTGNYQQSVKEFEQIEARLPFRMLWYQIEPILSYYEIGAYDTLFAVTDGVLKNQNRAFSELYFIRGQAYEQQQRIPQAIAEYRKAVLYNSAYKPAITALAKLQQ